MTSSQSISSRLSVSKRYSSSAREAKKTEVINNIRSKSVKGLKLRDLLKDIEQIESIDDRETLRKNFDAYISNLKHGNLSEEEFLQAIRDGRECVDLLNPKYHRLVTAMLSMEWLRRCDNVILEYQKFLHDILSAHNQYVIDAVDILIKCWISANTDERAWENGLPNEELKRRLKNVHYAIGVILDIIPLTMDQMMHAIEKNFPHHTKPSHVYAGYVYNMFWLLEYRPIFTNDLISLLFKRLVILDTNASKDDIERYERPDECDEDNIFQMDATKQYAENEMKYLHAETLDLCMVQLLSYIENEYRQPSRQSKILALLLKIFENLILPTYNSHHIQFSIFYYCSFQPTIMDSFVKLLWSKVKNFNESPVIRRTAVCYIASIMSRAKFIPIKYIQKTLKELCQWANNYVEQSYSSDNINTMKAHLLFYSVCHAIFYIIAVRIQDLIQWERDIIFLNDLQLGAIVKCSLNPLRVCPPATATIFASVTKKHQILYCQTILEKNARQKLATVYSNEIAKPDQTLDITFPFDPYMLIKSGTRIAPIYLEYIDDSTDDSDSPHSTPDRKRIRLDSFTLNDGLLDIIAHKKVMNDIARSLERDIHF